MSKIIIKKTVTENVEVKDVLSVSDIYGCSRLFYELGHKKDMNIMSCDNNWIREGEFTEIENLEEFIKLETRLVDPGFIKHHNFKFL